MIDVVLAPARLVTVFGTVLYVDPVSGQLRHGDTETSPSNAVFMADPGASTPHPGGWLTFEADRREGIHCSREGCVVASSRRAIPTLLELVPLERGLFTLVAEGLFLSANPDGRVTLAASVCSTWECYLSSEAWCTNYETHRERTTIDRIDWKRIREYVVHPRIRAQANTKPIRRKILIYGHTKFPDGRLYYDMCKLLHRQGYIVDVLASTTIHDDYIEQLVAYYDLFMTSLDCVGTLIDRYRVPCERLIAVSYSENDIRLLIDQKGPNIFDRIASYGVVGESLYGSSLKLGIRRQPLVVPLGIDYQEFWAEIPQHLQSVGYVSANPESPFEVGLERGDLAEATAREAGLGFEVADSNGKQTSIHDMPGFYRRIDALLMTSIYEETGLPALEAAAAGKLVISFPVGHFSHLALNGVGIAAPIDARRFKEFAISVLRYYKENPSAFAEKCRLIQDSARQFDWQNSIGRWVEMIERAGSGHGPLECDSINHAEQLQRARRFVDASRSFGHAADAGDGRAEKTWYAKWQQSRCLRAAGDHKGFVQIALEAFRMRPTRAEPLCDLSRHYLSVWEPNKALFYADAGLALPCPDEDRFGVEKEIYQAGLYEAFISAGTYSDDVERKDRARDVANWLAMSRDVPASVRQLARRRLRWLAEPGGNLMPSLLTVPLSVPSPDGFVPGNVSIVPDRNGYLLTVRAVNYQLLESGYFDRYGDTSFRNRVLLVRLDERFKVTSTTEVFLPRDFPAAQHSDSLGFEDPRPFYWRGELWCISAVRQLNSEGRAEMVLARIAQDNAEFVFTDWRSLPSGRPLQWEKNWMTQVDDDNLRFIYGLDPIRIIDERGSTLHEEAAPVAIDNFRGGSQAVRFDDGWLMVVHEWELVRSRRHYLHRLVWLDASNRLVRLSRRFFFRRLASEFASGLTWNSTGDQLVISFGTNDHDPALALVEADDVRAALLDIPAHRRAFDDAVAEGRRSWRLLKDGDTRAFDGDAKAIRARAKYNMDGAERSRAKKVLLFTGVLRAFGSVHSELVRYLHSRGIVADVLDWSKGYNPDEISLIARNYDYVYGIPGETWPLTDNYGIPHDKIVVVAHGDYHLWHAIDRRTIDEFDRFAEYAVISDYLRQLSIEMGIRRIPKVVRLGINYRRFNTAISGALKVVGYGGSMHRDDNGGVDWKRGVLAKQAVEAAGLTFCPAARYGQLHFLAMPRYYSQVDALLVSSSREGYGLPAMEAAAAGRLVISTPVGGFPHQAALGAGIIAPLDDLEYKEFVADTLTYFKERPLEYARECERTRTAAQQLDWEYVIDDWIELFAKDTLQRRDKD